jgi:hypothetical protein
MAIAGLPVAILVGLEPPSQRTPDAHRLVVLRVNVLPETELAAELEHSVVRP